jgi:hypothetical protein
MGKKTNNNKSNKQDSGSTNTNGLSGTFTPTAPKIKYIPELTNCVFHVGGLAQFNDQVCVIADYCKVNAGGLPAWQLVHGKVNKPKEPDDPPNGANKIVMAKWDAKYKFFLKEMKEFESMEQEVFGIVKAQCDSLVKSRLTAAPDFDQIEEDGNVPELINRIRAIVSKQLDGQYKHWLLAQDMRALFSYRMGAGDTIHTHATQWKELLKSVTARWGDFGPTKLATLETASEEQSKFQACLFLCLLDRSRFDHVVRDLNNDFLLTQQGYPKSIDDMVTYIDGRMDHKHKSRKNNKPGTPNKPPVDGENEGTRATSFSQTADNDSDGDIEETQFHQAALTGFRDFSFVSTHDSDSESDTAVDWHGGPYPKKPHKGRNGRSTAG